MGRLLLISICSVFMVGAPGISFAVTTTKPPAKKITAPVKAAVRAAAPVTRAAAPVARGSAPAAPSPAALQAAAMSTAARAPASASANSSKDISEELKIMGQSRNLSMGLLFQKDKDKLTFGTPRTNYEDKVSDKKANF
jgi:hypothetical protein